MTAQDTDRRLGGSTSVLSYRAATVQGVNYCKQTQRDVANINPFEFPSRYHSNMTQTPGPEIDPALAEGRSG
jgi:hypothetical protein